MQLNTIPHVFTTAEVHELMDSADTEGFVLARHEDIMTIKVERPGKHPRTIMSAAMVAPNRWHVMAVEGLIERAE